MTSSRNLVDPQLRDFFDNFPVFELSDATVGIIRTAEASAVVMATELPDCVTRQEITVAAYGSSANIKRGVDVRALLYTPVNRASTGAAYLHIHGGGMVLGAPENSDDFNVALCAKLGILIVSVDYRLAPQDPFPAALYDCYAVLAYLHSHADSLGVDTNRIAVGGESAGGGLAASLAIFARDEAEYAICHQQLVYPMLDSTTGVAGSHDDPRLGEFCWTREFNVYGWQSYLAGQLAEDAYVPAATHSLKDLPPAWIACGDLDLFLPENQIYVERLSTVGVNAAMFTYAGAPHGFTEVRAAAVAKQFEHDFFMALSAGLSI
ncbi:MAG: acetyl esterase/lipase [Cryomorphaceae bacterium]|jgi:acetyl esterase/lipase